MGGPLTVLIDGLTAETRTAVLEGHESVRYAVHPPSASPRVGDIFMGRVRALGTGGVFVDLGGGLDGFLPENAAAGIGEGDPVAVEVRREGGQGKGCRLARATIDEDPGMDGPGLISRGPSPGARLLASLDAESIGRVVVEGGDTVRELRAACPALAERIEHHAVGAPLFDAFGIEDDIDAVLEPTVALEGGGRLIVEETAACIAIDVDSGTDTPKHVNRAAVPAVVREIGRRGLSGVVFIDPAGSNDRRVGYRMAEALTERFEAAGLDGEVKGVTRAGLVEVVIRRERESVVATLSRLRARAYAAIRAAHKAALASPGKPVAIRANVDLTELLARDAFAPERRAFEERHGAGLHLVTDNAMARGMFEATEHRP